MIDIDLKPNKKKLRQFSWISFAFFTGVATFLFLKHGSGLPVYLFGGIGAYALLCGIMLPKVILPLYLLLSFVSFPIGFVVSHVLLFLIYLCVFFPTGFCLRLTGRDIMGKRFEKNIGSRWIACKTNRTPSSYYKQF